MNYYLIFFVGLLSGVLVRRPRLFQAAHWTMVGCGYSLIMLFGFQMASAFRHGDSRLVDVASAGAIAVSAATGSVAFSYLFIVAIRKIFLTGDPTLPTNDAPDSSVAQHPKNVWRPVYSSLTLLLIGLASGRLLPVVPVESAIKCFLWLMILAVGFQSAQELRTLTDRRECSTSATSPSLLLLFGLPVAVMMGTLCFSAGAGLFLRYGWRDCMLCAAPMGWQTLGGPMIQELRGLQLGNVAFLTNMFRDVVALVMIPLVSRRGYALLSVTPGGVSSMDILLPGIMVVSGRQSLIFAMWMGASCSFWAPILIYLIAKGI